MGTSPLTSSQFSLAGKKGAVQHQSEAWHLRWETSGLKSVQGGGLNQCYTAPLNDRQRKVTNDV